MWLVTHEVCATGIIQVAAQRTGENWEDWLVTSPARVQGVYSDHCLFDTYEAAVLAAERVRVARLERLKAQVARLEALTFQTVELTHP